MRRPRPTQGCSAEKKEKNPPIPLFKQNLLLLSLALNIGQNREDREV